MMQCRNAAALTPGWLHLVPIFVADLPAESIEFGRKWTTGGKFGHWISVIWIGVLVMQTDPPKHHTRRRSEPSLWVDAPVDDALSLLGNALCEDQPVRRSNDRRDDIRSLREENARLRELLAQLSEPIRQS
jgi:hypothetical protein